MLPAIITRNRAKRIASDARGEFLQFVIVFFVLAALPLAFAI